MYIFIWISHLLGCQWFYCADLNVLRKRSVVESITEETPKWTSFETSVMIKGINLNAYKNSKKILQLHNAKYFIPLTGNFYSTRRLIESRIIESAEYCNQILLVPWYPNSTKNTSVNWISQLLLSLLYWAKAVVLNQGAVNEVLGVSPNIGFS